MSGGHCSNPTLSKALNISAMEANSPFNDIQLVLGGKHKQVGKKT
jgi:hypothetical protein